MKLLHYLKICLVLMLITTTVIAQPQPPVRLKFKRVADWNNGCTIKITIINIEDTVISGWKVAFTMIPQMDANAPPWNCIYTNNSGMHVFTNETYNGIIQPKDSVDFNFQCTYTGNFKAPLPCTFNDQPNHFEHYNINNNANCGGPPSYYLNSETYLPTKEIKIGQGRLYKIWGVSADAYIPQNRLSWAIAMVHAHQLFRNMVRTNTVPLNFYFTTALKESFCGCDPGITVQPGPFPLTHYSSTMIDGCFQIESTSAYAELMKMYPQRFPAGGHTTFVANDNFETAALVKAYYDIFTVKFLHISKGFKPVDFFNVAKDSLAGLKVIAVAYNRGLWSELLVSLLDKDRTAALATPDLLTLFPSNQSIVHDYVTSISNCSNLLDDKAYRLPPNLLATNPQTGLPYNIFFNYYDTLVAWSDINAYVDKISGLYPGVNMLQVKGKLQQRFNGIQNGNPISFRYEFPAIINDLMLLLPVDDPGEYISSYYGCLDNQITSTEEEVNGKDELLINYPNPAQHFTTIPFTLHRPSAVTLKLYDYRGAVVYKAPVVTYPSGSHAVKISTEQLSEGIYFYQLSTDKTVQTKKMLIVK